MEAIKISNRTPVPAIEWLFIIFWCRSSIIEFVLQVIKRIPYLGLVYEYIVPAIVAFLLIVAIIQIKRVNVTDLIIVAVIFVAITFGAIKYSEAGSAEWKAVYIYALPLLLMGLLVDGRKFVWRRYTLFNSLFLLSALNIIATICYVFYFMTTRAVSNDSMHWAYTILPSILMVIYYAFTKKKLFAWVIAALGMLYLFSMGTRGPVVCALTMFVLLVIERTDWQKNWWLLVAIAVIVLIIGQTDLLINITKQIRNVIADIGLSTRSLDLLLNRNILYDAGRNNITQTLIDAVKERPLLGYGIFADRYLSNYGTYATGRYAHNILIEMWIDFGIVIGTILCAVLAWLCLKGLKDSKRDTGRQGLLMVFICIGIVKLLMSGSYLLEPYFFLLIGYSINIIRKTELQNQIHIEGEM